MRAHYGADMWDRRGASRAKVMSMAAVLAVALSACETTGDTTATPSRSGSTSTTSAQRPPTTSTRATSSAPITTRLGTVEAVIAHPKRVDYDTKCSEIITTDDVKIATGRNVLLSNPRPLVCIYVLQDSNGDNYAGTVDITFQWSRVGLTTI